MLIHQRSRDLIVLSKRLAALGGVRLKQSKPPAIDKEPEKFESMGMAVIFKLFAPDRSRLPTGFRLDPTHASSQRWRQWKERQVNEIEKTRQRFLPERIEALGNDLAAAHFVVYRGGKVRFDGQTEWIGLDPKTRYCEQLPGKFVRGLFLEGIDMSRTPIMFEGLDNLQYLHKLKTLILRGCPKVDDWFVDRISGQLKHLEYLDLSDCPNVTDNALSCLYRLQNLKTLVLENTANTPAFQLACLLLEEAIPNLVVEGVKYIECKVQE